MLAMFLYLLWRRNSRWYSATRCCINRRVDAEIRSDVSQTGKAIEKPEDQLAIKFSKEVAAPSNRSNQPWVDRCVRMMVAPALTYISVGSIVGLIFFILNPHYYIFIFE